MNRPLPAGAGTHVAPKRALVSVSDKTGLRELCDALVRMGCELFATSSTRAALSEWGLSVHSVESATGFPEILGGRVKTLHPVVFGGILARASVPEDAADLAKHGLAPFDVVVCNLYPFQQTLEKLDANDASALSTLIEKIDIGGVTLLRAAAKNLERVAILCDPRDYEEALAEMRAHDGRTTPHLRARLAIKALQETASYDAVISSTLAGLLSLPPLASGPVRERGLFEASRETETLPETLHMEFTRVQPLRYGENPHQSAAFYAASDTRERLVAKTAAGDTSCALPALTCFHGKELSYNNVLDVEHAVRLVNEFTRPAAVIVKHNMPCGVAQSEDGVAVAYARAFESDPVSPFGGIVAFNREVTADAAKQLHETFLEVVVAPDFSADAQEILQRKKNLRLVRLDTRKPLANRWQLSHVQGGLLVQRTDASLWNPADLRTVTKTQMPKGSEEAVRFAYSVVKHVRSNAIVLAGAGKDAVLTLAIAGGFTNRVDAVRHVLRQARLPLEGAILASDAFFPFPDSIELLKGTGVRAIVQPGGSVQDESVIAACNDAGLAMAFTGQRHFKH